MNFSLQSLIRPPKPHWRLALDNDVEQIVAPKPVFNVQVGSVPSYEDMFSGAVQKVWTEADIIQESLRRGRLLLSGRGGGAKTVLLGRLARRAVKMGCVPVFLSLKRWTQAHSEQWRRFESSLVRMDFIFRALLTAGIGTAELDSLHASVPRLILLDGLNEVDGRTAQELIFSLDEYASSAVNTSVIVSDRLVRREFVNPERWLLSLVLPLKNEEIQRQLAQSSRRDKLSNLSDDERELLSSPFFLDAYLHTGELGETRAEEIARWFKTHVGLTEDDLDRASRAAYEVYGGASRSFALDAFENIAGADATRKLTDSGTRTLLVESKLAIFDHHLKHDFLASRYVAQHDDLWNRESFEHVTFSGSSFDAIMMCVEQIPDGPADKFIRRVYDWNLYGVGYSLGESRRNNVSAEMRTVILAMFAERKWDLVAPTSQKAYDTLRQLKDKGALPFLEAKSLNEVFTLVLAHTPSPQQQWFDEWRRLFTLAAGSQVQDELVRSIADVDSVRGWTTANVLKRVRLTDLQQQTLRNLVSDNDPVIRWRAAHALGSFISDLNSTSLLNLLRDQDKNVRYGAVRSILELLSRADGDLRRRVFTDLLRQRESLIEFPSVREEVRRCVLIPSARDHSDWLSNCLRLMSALQPVETESERDRWSRAAQQLIDMFETDRIANA